MNIDPLQSIYLGGVYIATYGRGDVDLRNGDASLVVKIKDTDQVTTNGF